MNVFVGTGRIGRVEVKAMGQTNALTFSLAIPRPYKRNGETITDWFNCQSFNDNIVKNVSKWLNQGDRVSIQGSVEINQTDKGTFTNINVSQITLLETQSDRQQAPQQQQQQRQQRQQPQNNNQGYYEAPQGNVDPTSDLPF